MSDDKQASEVQTPVPAAFSRRFKRSATLAGGMSPLTGARVTTNPATPRFSRTPRQDSLRNFHREPGQDPLSRLGVTPEQIRKFRQRRYSLAPNQLGSSTPNLPLRNSMQNDSDQLTFYASSRTSRFRGISINNFGYRDCVHACTAEDVLFTSSRTSLVHWNPERVTTAVRLDEPSKESKFPGKAQIDCFNVCNNLLTVADSSGNVNGRYLWSGDMRFSLQLTQAAKSKEPVRARAVLLSPHSSSAMDVVTTCNDKTLRVIDIETSKPRNIAFEFGVNHTEVCFGPFGHLYGIAGELEDGVIFDPKSGSAVHWLKGHTAKLTSCAWDSTGLKFATGSYDQTCRLWDIRNTAEPLHTQSSVMATIRSLKFTNNGHFLAIGEEVDFVQILDMRDLTSVQEIERFGEIGGISFAPDDSMLFIAIADPNRVHGGKKTIVNDGSTSALAATSSVSTVTSEHAPPQTPMNVHPVPMNSQSETPAVVSTLVHGDGHPDLIKSAPNLSRLSQEGPLGTPSTPGPNMPGSPPVSARARVAMESGEDIWIGSLCQFKAVEKLVHRDKRHYRMNAHNESINDSIDIDESGIFSSVDSEMGDVENAVPASVTGFTRQALGDSRICLQHARALFEAHLFTGCVHYCNRSVATQMLTPLEHGRVLLLRGLAHSAGRDYPRGLRDLDAALNVLTMESKEERGYRVNVLLEKAQLLAIVHRYDAALSCIADARAIQETASEVSTASALMCDSAQADIAKKQQEIVDETSPHEELLDALQKSNSDANSRPATPVDRVPALTIHEGTLHECTVSGNRKGKKNYVLFSNVLIPVGDVKKAVSLTQPFWIDTFTPGGQLAFGVIFPEAKLNMFFTALDIASLNEWLAAFNFVSCIHRQPNDNLFRRTLRYQYSDGGVYNGEYQVGKRVGHGTHIYAISGGADEDSSFSMVEKWVGEWREDFPHRQGTYYYANGDKFIGEMKRGERHGSGKLKSVDGSVYEGGWKDDKREGPGSLRNADGSNYQGEWKNNMKDGLGLMVYSDGTQYSGRWKEDKFHGHGIVSRRGALLYDGEWQGGHKHGKGKVIYEDGSEYEGDWQDDLRHGKGVLKQSDGTTYAGNWWTDERNGVGALTLPSGDYIVGMWSTDKEGQIEIKSARFTSALDHAYINANAEVQQASLTLARTKIWESLFAKFSYDENSRRRDESWRTAPVVSTLTADLLQRLCSPDHPFGVFLNEFDLAFRSHKEGSFGATRTELNRSFVNDVLSFIDKLDDLIIATYPGLEKLMPINRRLRCIYHVVFDKIYDPLFAMYKEKYEAESERYDEVFEDLSSITPAHCFTSAKFHLTGVAEPYDPAIQTLRSITAIRDPVVKLERLVHASRQIEECILDYYGDSKAPDFGADISWPIFQYILVKAAPANVMAELQLLKDFFDSELEDMEGFSYRLMVFEATLELVGTLSSDRVDDEGVLVPEEDE